MRLALSVDTGQVDIFGGCEYQGQGRKARTKKKHTKSLFFGGLSSYFIRL